MSEGKPNQLKNVSYEDLDQAVKASYQLGIIEGENSKRIQLEEMRIQLRNMLKTNKELFNLTSQRDDKCIKLTPCFVRRLLSSLRGKNYNQYLWLKQKYDAKMKENTGIEVEETEDV